MKEGLYFRKARAQEKKEKSDAGVVYQSNGRNVEPGSRENTNNGTPETPNGGGDDERGQFPEEPGELK